MKCLRLLFIGACILIFISIPANVFASEVQMDYCEIALPDDFSYSVNDTCSNHYYFHQVTARSDGLFLICSHHIDSDPTSSNTFYRQYIDLYSSDGAFVREYSFCTEQPYVAELSDTGINLYFYNYKVCIDLDSGEPKCFSIPAVHVANNDAYDHLRRSKFSVGEWNYYCTQSLEGYTQLFRENGSSNQLLVDMPGMEKAYGIVSACILVMGIATILGCFLRIQSSK